MIMITLKLYYKNKNPLLAKQARKWRREFGRRRIRIHVRRGRHLFIKEKAFSIEGSIIQKKIWG